MKYKYNITPDLLKKITEITRLYTELKMQVNSSQVVLFELEKSANALSSFSSTSIEGNPPPLTEVKKILKSRPVQLRKSEQEVINYNEAMLWLNEFLKKGDTDLSLELILKIHSIVMKGLLPKIKFVKNQFLSMTPNYVKQFFGLQIMLT